MKIINISSAYASDGKSSIIRLLAEDFSKLSKKCLIIDNSSEVKSGFRRMYNMKNIAGIDAIMAFLKGEILESEQISDIILGLDEDIDYIPNSEIESLDQNDLLYIISILEKMKKYDIVIIENQKSLSNDRFDIANVYITRPCENILSNLKSLKKDCQYVVVNKFEKDFNMNCKKLGVYPISYDKEIVLMDNGYKHNLSSQTIEEIKSITSEILGFKDLLEENTSQKRKRNLLELFKR